eukprot:scaffold1318_cov388-Prasinococcus_capsulatus_cf.AAC.25
MPLFGTAARLFLVAAPLAAPRAPAPRLGQSVCPVRSAVFLCLSRLPPTRAPPLGLQGRPH